MPDIATPAAAANMPVNNRHHSKDMMQPSSVKRDSNVPSLDSEKVKIHDVALKQNPKPDRNSVEQNNIKNLDKLHFKQKIKA